MWPPSGKEVTLSRRLWGALGAQNRSKGHSSHLMTFLCHAALASPHPSVGPFPRLGRDRMDGTASPRALHMNHPSAPAPEAGLASPASCRVGTKV